MSAAAPNIPDWATRTDEQREAIIAYGAAMRAQGMIEFANDAWISPGDDEREAVDRGALDAAASELPDSDVWTSDEAELSELVRSVLAAFAAVNRVSSESSAAFRALHAGDRVHGFYIEPARIVASALYATMHDMRLDDVHPSCVGSTPYLAFAAACVALEGLSSVENALDGEGPFGSDHAQRALTAFPSESAS